MHRKRRWLKRLELNDWQDKKVEDLSRGMQQKLQIITQLIDNMQKISEKCEQAYNKNDGVEFNRAKEGILENQKKISELIG